jgi:PLP dependent protein
VTAPPGPPRRAEIAANLGVVRDRISAACARTGRDPDGVTLVAVTKTYPADDVLILAELGVRDIGENRDQEAAPKAAQVAAAQLAAGGGHVRWHFIGQLQRNKCASVVRYADLVQSVDRVPLVVTLADQAGRHRDRPLDVLVQVSLDGDLARGGAADVVAGASVDPDHRLDQVLAAVAGSASLRLRGLMAVAPIEQDPAVAYARLAEIAARTRDTYPSALVLSAGMSGDLEAAIDHGATHVRVGTALLGMRPALE